MQGLLRNLWRRYNSTTLLHICNALKTGLKYHFPNCAQMSKRKYATMMDLPIYHPNRAAIRKKAFTTLEISKKSDPFFHFPLWEMFDSTSWLLVAVVPFSEPGY